MTNLKSEMRHLFWKMEQHKTQWKLNNIESVNKNPDWERDCFLDYIDVESGEKEDSQNE